MRAATTVALLVLVSGCLEDEGPRPMGGDCASDSGCASGLICLYGRCRSPCDFDADCPEGRLCVATEDEPDRRACTLPDERGCVSACSTPGETCVDGVCRPGRPATCPRPQLRCGDVCVDVSSDREHCGSCGDACAESERCGAGECSGDPADCSLGFVTCSGECRDLSADPDHCGACDAQCDDLDHCSEGACVCRPELTDCAGTCVDVSSDPDHCGDCETSCGDTCVSGECLSSGDCGETYCPNTGVCVDVTLDPLHCGDCETSCPNDAVCIAGECLDYEPRDGCLDCGDCESCDSGEVCCDLPGYGVQCVAGDPPCG